MSDQPLLNLSVDIAGHDATYPLIPPGDYPLVIKHLTVEDNANKTGRNLVVEFATSTPLTSTRGKSIGVGHVLKNYYPLQATQEAIEKGNALKWKDRICLLIDAALNTTEQNRPNLTNEVAAALIGKTVLGAISIENNAQYGDQNRLGTIKPLV